MTDHNIEHYGPVHLHPNVYPLHANEQEMHMCDTGMYPCDDFTANVGSGESLCIPTGPQAQNHSSDPAERYGEPAGSAGEVSVGCMNPSCQAPNCHGTVRCAEGFIGGDLQGLSLNKILQYAILGFLLYFMYCKLTGKKMF